jgi:uncharacterized repeat protein (TIGR01451 family)
MDSGLVSRATSSTQFLSDAFDVLISTISSTHDQRLAFLQDAGKNRRAIIRVVRRLSLQCNAADRVMSMRIYVVARAAEAGKRVLRCGIGRPGRCAQAYGVLAGLFLQLTAASAGAAEGPGVVTQLIAEVRETMRTSEGVETYRFVPATLLSQGQVVYYTVRIQNPTPAYISDVSVTQRIPSNTAYIPGSAAAPAAEVAFSVDGAQTFVREEDLGVNSEGAQPAAPERYTHIRWTLRHALAPGAVALARFRAVFR